MEMLINELERRIQELYEVADWEYNYRAEDLMGHIADLLTQLREMAKATEDPHP